MCKRKYLYVTLICYIAYVGIYIARLNLSMASPELIDRNILTTQNLGLLGSAFSLVYSMGRLCNGYISDRNKPYILISIGLFFVGVSNILFGLFPPYIFILILWLINAYAQSMLWGSIVRIISNIYEPLKAKKVTSVMVSSVAVGNILGIVANTAIINNLGVQFAFIIPGGFTLICCMGTIFIRKDVSQSFAQQSEHSSIFFVLKNKEILTIFAPVMLHGVIKDNVTLWMTVYFIDTFAIDLKQSSYYILLIPIVGFLSRIIFPFLFKICKRDEFKIAIIFFIVCIAFSILITTNVNIPIFAVICLSMIYACVSVINTSFSLYPLRYQKVGNVASVSGMMDFATYLGSGISSFIYGIVISHFGYSPMFISWAVISIISILLLKRVYRMTTIQN